MDKENKIKSILKKLCDEKINPNKRTDLMMEVAHYYEEKGDFNEALKYGVLASICTQTPRADVCYFIGGIYFKRGIFNWAKFWTEKAINDNSSYDIVDEEWYTWKPLLQMSNIFLLECDLKNAYEYALGALDFQENNEEIKLMVDRLEKCL